MRYIKNRELGPKDAAPLRQPRKLFLWKRGSVAILFAFAAPILVMALAVGIEVSGWTVTQQRLQLTADLAATAAALAYSSNPNAQLAATEGAYVGELNGGQGTTTRPLPWNIIPNTLQDGSITVTKTTGIKSSADVAFVATIQKVMPLLFASIVLTGSGPTLTATATAEIVKSQVGQYCVLALDPNSGDIGVNASNGIAVDTSQCGIQVNGSGGGALTVVGGGSVTAKNISIVGGDVVNNGGSVTATVSLTKGAAPGTNPYAGVSVPTPGSCSLNSYNTGGANFTLNPVPAVPGGTPTMTFCNGLSIGNGENVTMPSGVYIINNGNLSLQGGSTLTATAGVTIVLTGSAPGIAQIANGTTLNLTAPTGGATQGIAIMQALGAPLTASSLAGGTNVNINGAVVFPSSIVDFSNGSTNNSNCTQLIAYQIVFEGGTRFGNNCAGTGTQGIGASSTTSLVQ
jgi:Flp pilus assembly protein TadG